MAYKFENLQIWQKALDLTDEINTLTKKHFPKDELFILTSQIKRAADSVVLILQKVVRAKRILY